MRFCLLFRAWILIDARVRAGIVVAVTGPTATGGCETQRTGGRVELPPLFFHAVPCPGGSFFVVFDAALHRRCAVLVRSGIFLDPNLWDNTVC